MSDFAEFLVREYSRATQSMVLANPKAHAIILGPFAETRSVLLTLVAYHFLMSDGDDE